MCENDPDTWTSQALFDASCFAGLGGTPAASAAPHRIQSSDARGCEGPAGPVIEHLHNLSRSRSHLCPNWNSFSETRQEIPVIYLLGWLAVTACSFLGLIILFLLGRRLKQPMFEPLRGGLRSKGHFCAESPVRSVRGNWMIMVVPAGLEGMTRRYFTLCLHCNLPRAGLFLNEVSILSMNIHDIFGCIHFKIYWAACPVSSTIRNYQKSVAALPGEGDERGGSIPLSSFIAAFAGKQGQAQQLHKHVSRPGRWRQMIWNLHPITNSFRWTGAEGCSGSISRWRRQGRHRQSWRSHHDGAGGLPGARWVFHEKHSFTWSRSMRRTSISKVASTWNQPRLRPPSRSWCLTWPVATWYIWIWNSVASFRQLRGSGCAVPTGGTWRLPSLYRTLAEDAVMFPEVDLLFPLSLLGDIGDINSISSVDDCWYITFGLTWDVVLLVRVLEGLYIGVSCHSLPQCHFVLFWFVIFVVQSFLCHLAPGALTKAAKVSVAPQIFSKSWAKRRLWRSWTSRDAPRFQQLRGSGCAVRNGLTWRLPDFIRTLAEDAVMFPEVDLLFLPSLLGDIGDINSINSVDDCWYITCGPTWDVVLLVRVLEGLYIGVSCHSLPQCHFVLFWFVIFVVQSFLCHLAPGALARAAKVSMAPQIFSKFWAKRRRWRSWSSADAPRFQQLRGSGCAVRNGLTWRLPDFIRTLAEDAVMFPEVDLLFLPSLLGDIGEIKQH